MDPSILVALAFLPFAVSHIGLGVPRIRTALVGRLGVWGFTWLFFAAAALTFGLAISTYAALSGTGVPGLGLGGVPVLGGALVALVVCGIALMAGALSGYASSPYSMQHSGAPAPTGLARVTRHPFFIGVAIVGGAHALLATHLAGAVWMASLGAFALVGAHLQDRKLIVQRGDDYADYMSFTSFVPFAAILAGRQRFVLRELPFTAIAVGLAFAFGLRHVHASIFDLGGVYVIGSSVGGALLIMLAEWHRSRAAATLGSSVSASDAIGKRSHGFEGEHGPHHQHTG